MGDSITSYPNLHDKVYKGYGVRCPAYVVNESYHALYESYVVWYCKQRENKGDYLGVGLYGKQLGGQ